MWPPCSQDELAFSYDIQLQFCIGSCVLKKALELALDPRFWLQCMTDCVALSKLCNLSGLHFPVLWYELTLGHLIKCE